MKNLTRGLFPMSILLLVTLACQLVTLSSPATPTSVEQPPAASPTRMSMLADTALPVPSSTSLPLPSATAIPADTQIAPFSVNRNPISEKSLNPPYEINIIAPILTGPAGASVDNFNVWISLYMSRLMDGFKNNVNTAYQQATPDPNLGSAVSGLFSEYELLYQSDEIVSLLLKNSEYMAGAAHPLPYARSANYWLPRARILALADLFHPGVDFLAAISVVCQHELQNNEAVTSLDGAAPRPENYQNWNITPAGLLITFDPYQVAAYAAGYITVTVPYAELSVLLDPDGPAASMIP